MKTLVFCTSYVEAALVWELRHRLWIRSLQQSSLDFDQLLIVDDASPTLPEWEDLTVFDEVDAPSAKCVQSNAAIILYRHTSRLGRQSVFEFPGWHRSYAFGVAYGSAHGYDKIIHIESDAHLISKRMTAYLNDVASGWIAMWCQKYSMPEIAIQAAAGEEVSDMLAFASEPYDRMAGRNHELLFPFSEVVRRFKGDRYGEDPFGSVPRDADYSSQTLIGMNQHYYWWLERDHPPMSRIFMAPFCELQLVRGWASPDPGFVWMTGFESELRVDSSDISEFDSVEFNVSPCLYADRQSQRLFLLVNNVLVGEWSLTADGRITCGVGGLPSSSDITIRFVHPDAFAAASIGDHEETRMLSLALSELRLV